LFSSVLQSTFTFFLCVRDRVALGYWIPTFGAPPCFKHENNPDDATEKNQPTSTSRRSLTHRPKPTHIPTTTYSNTLYHYQRNRAPDLRQHTRNSATVIQHIHHYSRNQPEWRRSQLHPNQRRQSAPQHKPPTTTAATACQPRQSSAQPN
jgi:hypothetical protein